MNTSIRQSPWDCADAELMSRARKMSASDQAHFDFAREEHRVIVTQDPDFVQAHYEGVPHGGIVFCEQGSRSVGEIIEALMLIFGVFTLEEMQGQLEYI